MALPIAALAWRSTQNGGAGFWDVVSSPEAVAALKLTLAMAALAALTNAVLGTITPGSSSGTTSAGSPS